MSLIYAQTKNTEQLYHQVILLNTANIPHSRSMWQRFWRPRFVSSCHTSPNYSKSLQYSPYCTTFKLLFLKTIVNRSRKHPRGNNLFTRLCPPTWGVPMHILPVKSSNYRPINNATTQIHNSVLYQCMNKTRTLAVYLDTLAMAPFL